MFESSTVSQSNDRCDYCNSTTTMKMTITFNCIVFITETGNVISTLGFE